MINKLVDNFAAALAGLKDGDTLLCGGFGSVGEPFALIEAVIAALAVWSYRETLD